jgi:hemerythrin-like domain-containing protein
MQNNDVSPWMLEEHAKIHDLGEQLQAKVAAPPREGRARWLEELRGCYHEFAERLRRHMKAEEEGGYLTHVREMRPTLSEAVDIIHHEHEELRRIVADVQSAVDELKPTDVLLTRDCCKRIEHLLLWVERHDEHENHIVMYAFTQDIGTPD